MQARVGLVEEVERMPSAAQCLRYGICLKFRRFIYHREIRLHGHTSLAIQEAAPSSVFPKREYSTIYRGMSDKREPVAN